VSEAGGKSATPLLLFGDAEWAEEVARYRSTAVARTIAEVARREIESGKPKLVWRRCEPEGSGGTRLPGCRKLYIPLGEGGPSAAPFGFVFQLVLTGEGLAWAFLAFGERHPENPATRSVYERAHHRLHGRYPNP
jgi:hypothetical protein